MSVKETIKKVIEREGVSYSEFARQVGTHRQRVSAVISGERSPRIDLIEKILQAFPYYNAEWLVTGRGKMLKAEKSKEYDNLQEAKNGYNTDKDPWQIITELRAQLKAEREMKEYFIKRYEEAVQKK